LDVELPFHLGQRNFEGSFDIHPGKATWPVTKEKQHPRKCEKGAMHKI
jgi:hypothetical protein